MPVVAKNTVSKKMMGYWPEVMEAIAASMQLKIEWTEELNLGTYLQDLNNGRYDLECAGGWPNATRGKFIYYTNPIYYSPLVPFVRAEDKRFDSGLDTLNNPNLSAAVVDGDTSQIIRHDRFPQMKEVSLPQVSTINEYFLVVITGKADMTFSDYTGALDYMKNNPGKIKPLPYVLRLVPQNIGVPMGDNKLLSMLNTATLQLQTDGTFDRILAKYGDSLKLLRIAKPYQVENKP
jgi:ABC-type amino acid transport substrate-binding protein